MLLERDVCALHAIAISNATMAVKSLFFIFFCFYVIHVVCRLGSALLVEGVQDIAIDDALQSLVSTYNLVHPLYLLLCDAEWMLWLYP